jgi:hypothetical protein
MSDPDNEAGSTISAEPYVAEPWSSMRMFGFFLLVVTVAVFRTLTKLARRRRRRRDEVTQEQADREKSASSDELERSVGIVDESSEDRVVIAGERDLLLITTRSETDDELEDTKEEQSEVSLVKKSSLNNNESHDQCLENGVEANTTEQGGTSDPTTVEKYFRHHSPPSDECDESEKVRDRPEAQTTPPNRGVNDEILHRARMNHFFL